MIAGLFLACWPAIAPLARIPAPPAPDGVHEQAAALLEAEDWEAACDLLRPHLRRRAGDGEGHLLIGRALLALEERDEAAHHLARAAAILEERGDGKRAKLARRDLVRADPLNGRRERIFREITSKLYKAAEQLFESGHPERALELLVRLRRVASGRDAERVVALREEVSSAFREVDLDRAGSERSEAGHWPLVTVEGEHYRVEANLEPELARLVADTMDDIHGYYVQVYLDGDDEAPLGQSATIRIHPTRESMLEGWSGGNAPEGWWSPGQNRVTCYDTRTTTGDLDWMLETLFHESSHQFMTILCRRGGWSPAWLNEGTSTFFEGATAMADHRVLWPDAALGRLRSLAGMLESGRGPSLAEVIGYAGRGSYPGEYYSFGWGLIFFMQQCEDPVTLEYVYRPLYGRYRERITTRGGDSMELFRETFLGEDSPLGHESLEAFGAAWKAWILEEVKPLHLSPKPERRERRLERLERYRTAAAAAAEDRKAPVSEADLLRRALGHVEYVRSRIDGEEDPDVELIALQADIFEALEQPRSAAPLVQSLLDLADEEVWAPTPEEYDALERRLKELDRRNWALRRAKSASRALARSSRKLLEDYTDADDPMPLRAYTFAARAGRALADKEVLLPAASELRARVRELGLLAGELHSLVAPRKEWMTIYSAEAKEFQCTPEFITLEAVRPAGYLNTSIEVGDEYEVRGIFRRAGDQHLSTCHGLVVAGVREGDWLVFGLITGGQAGLWRLRLGGGGGVTTKRIERFFLDPPPDDDEDLEVRVHVTDGREVRICVGECEVIETELPEDLPDGRYVGVYVKDGTTRIESPVIEIYP